MMVCKSDLNIEKLTVIACNLATVPVTTKQKQPLFDYPDLDTDFKILSNSNDKSRFKLFLSISCNVSENKKPGYSFSLVSEGMFQLLNAEDKEKEVIDQYLLYTALPILISHVRTYLLNTTSYYPYGAYILPCFDLATLIKEQTEKLK